MRHLVRIFLALQAALLVMPVLLAPATAFASTCCSCKIGTSSVCLTDMPNGDCAAIASGPNADLKGAQCSDVDQTKCKPIADGGLCTGAATSAITYKKGSTTSTAAGGFTIKITAPNLNVPIPGLAFQSDREVQLTTGGKISIPFLSQYIAAVYKYLVGISVVAAAIMIVYGGFLYVLGASFANKSMGKEVIQDAVIGLALLLGAVTVLDTVNKNITEGLTHPLEIFAIMKLEKPLEIIDTKTYYAAVAGPGGKVDLDTTDCQFPLQTQGKFAGTPTSRSVYECGIKLAALNNVHPCFAVVALNRESGGLVGAIGHDENAPIVGGVIVPPRAQYLRAGKKYSGATFVRPAGFPDDCNKTTRDTCIPIIKANQSNLNDDKLDPAKDDWGLDWRYSHGIGVKQVTIFPRDSDIPWCDKSIPSRSVGGKCMTIRDLLLPVPALAGGLELLKGAGANMNPTSDSALKAWIAYAGGAGGEPSLRTTMVMGCIQDNGNDPMAARADAGKAYDK